MTCQEMHELCSRGDITRTSMAEWAAMLAHTSDCQECMEKIRSRKRIDLNSDQLRRVEEIRRRLANDPECLLTLERR